ncbi:uncharacterized protein LOC8063214 [Sorghum bicolor]|uniref:Uncharacterized protein n=1 Tax=Sorghum bicolor TaxID=4558 RepID=C5WVK9_SORBI|nr:uncharacterized protein LOC8063214 [Sorghum bicolor]EER94659.1 hypothetical protein SORBI_3001G328800 [Sorghum bicolor]|eukprot:XP_002467661.1 uncharacterized protein LOC8063214 [Sorghum bicolor]
MSRYHLKQYEKEHMKMAMLKQEETFRQQVQELHRLYRVQQLLTAKDAANEATMAMPPAAARRCKLEDDDERRRAAENDAGSSRSWPDDAYSRQQQGQGNNNKAPPPLVLQESELELTLALGCFGAGAAAGTKKAAVAAKKEASSSVDSRTSFSSSSTESGSPDDCGGVRRLPPPSLIGSVLPGQQPTSAGSVGQRRLEQEGLPQPPPWIHKCLNLAR